MYSLVLLDLHKRIILQQLQSVVTTIAILV